MAAFGERPTSPGVRALAAQQAARGHPITGDAATADHHTGADDLAAAAGCLARPSADAVTSCPRHPSSR